MRVLKYSDYILESESFFVGDFYRSLPDQYRINVSEKGIAKIVYEKKEDSVFLYFINSKGEKNQEIVIPGKDITFLKEGGDLFVKISKSNGWGSLKNNQLLIDEFMEEFIDFKIRHDSEDLQDTLDVESTICTLLDALDLDFNISKLEKKPEFFEIVLDSGAFVNLFSGSSNNLFDLVNFYNKQDDVNPSISIKIENKVPHIEYFHSDLGRGNFSEDLTQIKNNPYLNYLLRKCLNVASKKEEEALVSYYKSRFSSGDFDKEIDSQSELESRRFIKELKKAILTFFSEEDLKRS
jgi:hypothetical protein